MNVAVFGAGIAGLSTAHFLMENGYNVTVIESLNVPGGLARSERVNGDEGMPSEYSWRGFGPWYHNTYDLMKKIPVSQNKSVYDVELSHPITFLLANDNNTVCNGIFSSTQNISSYDKLILYLIILRVFSACNERRDLYSSINASNYIHTKCSFKSASELSQLFGPWVGSDSTRVSLLHVSEFFFRNMFPGKIYYHDLPKPSFTQSGGDGWLILRRPSNESWFDPWVTFLKSKNVKFEFNTSLIKINYDFEKNKIVTAMVNSNGIYKYIYADIYVLAVNPYITCDILKKSPEILSIDNQLQKFIPLTSDNPHVQISFRIAFSEKINFKNIQYKELAVILVDSEFDITLFPQDELWNENVYLGKNIKSLWSGTATIDTVPGKLYGLPLNKLTKKQFTNEIIYQINKCKCLDKLIKENNNGRPLNSFQIAKIEVWHTWEFIKQPFSNQIISDPIQPKWVNNTRNKKYQPSTKTSISNLFLAGAHTQTYANLYSMEAAVESGKRVSDIITGQNTIIQQYVPFIIILLRIIDNVLYNIGLPDIFCVTTYLLIFIIFILILILIKL
jgi:uncharacterized protein with NAD-binding domain and iron-sulfur cluster